MDYYLHLVPSDILELIISILDLKDYESLIYSDITPLCIINWSHVYSYKFNTYTPIDNFDEYHKLLIIEKLKIINDELKLDYPLFELNKAKRLTLGMVKVNLNYVNTDVHIPREIEILNKLRHLCIHSRKFVSIPDELVNLKKLQEIHINAHKINNIEVISRLTNLKILSLEIGNMIEIPSWIFGLTQLERLYLEHCDIKEIPRDLIKLKILRSLGLGANRIRDIPTWIYKLTNLDSLELANNPINILTLSNIQYMYNLTNLYLTSIKMEIVPNFIGTLINLTSLALSGIKIKEVPKFINNLISLERLMLRSNKITDNSINLNKLVNLEVLYLDNNRLSKVPNWIINLTKLNRFSLINNGIQEIPEYITDKFPFLEIFI